MYTIQTEWKMTVFTGTYNQCRDWLYSRAIASIEYIIKEMK